jgi:hypothetical protein
VDLTAEELQELHLGTQLALLAEGPFYQLLPSDADQGHLGVSIHLCGLVSFLQVR